MNTPTTPTTFESAVDAMSSSDIARAITAGEADILLQKKMLKLVCHATNAIIAEYEAHPNPEGADLLEKSELLLVEQVSKLHSSIGCLNALKVELETR